jgi:RNA recognition motif-containing protein
LLLLLLLGVSLQVVVHNLPWSTTWQQLKDMFKEFKVERADVVYDTWGKSRWVGAGVGKGTAAAAGQGQAA